MPFKQAFGAAASPVAAVSAVAIAAAIGYFIYTDASRDTEEAPPVAAEAPADVQPTGPAINALDSANAVSSAPSEPVVDVPKTVVPPVVLPSATTPTKKPAASVAPIKKETVSAQDVAPDTTIEAAMESVAAKPAVVAEIPAIPHDAESNAQTIQTLEATTTETPDTRAPIAVVPALSAPTVDVVRIPPEGISTVAGRADAGSDILIFVDGIEMARAKAGASGEYVALFDIPSVERPREMQVAAQKGEIRVFASSSIIIAPFMSVPDRKPVEAPKEPAVVAMDTFTSDIAKDLSVDLDGEDVRITQEDRVADTTKLAQSDVFNDEARVVADVTGVEMAKTDVQDVQAVSEPVEVTIPNETPVVAPTVMVADDTGVKILQSAAPITGVSIDAITYDPDGAVFASGRGMIGTTVRLYLSNAPLTETSVGVDGQWRAKMDVDAGIYSLRADMLDATGKVLSRVEIPFKREDVAVLERLAQGAAHSATVELNQKSDAQNKSVETEGQGDVAQTLTAETAPQGAPQPRINSVTVQPGNTLWGIASKTYGDGFLFARVFRANVAQIRDPDLIYPGQVFVLPDK